MLNPNMDPTLRRERNSTRQLTSSSSTMGRGIGERPMKRLTIAVAVALIAPLPGLSHAMAGNHGKSDGAGEGTREKLGPTVAQNARQDAPDPAFITKPAPRLAMEIGR